MTAFFIRLQMYFHYHNTPIFHKKPNKDLSGQKILDFFKVLIAEIPSMVS